MPWASTIMLLGKVGHGKTATASSIIQRRFSYSMDETTTDVFKTGSCTSADGVSKVDVIDSPGLFKTYPVDDVQDTTRMFDHIEKAVNINAEGINAFVIVFRFGTRYTDDEQKVVRNLEQAFGQKFFANHVIVIFTNGGDYRLKHGSAPFEDWVVSQMADLRKLFDMCQGRCLLFDNVTCTAETDAEQRGKLLETVSRMTKKFTTENYEKTKPQRDKHLSDLGASWKDFVPRFIRNRFLSKKPSTIMLLGKVGDGKTATASNILNRSTNPTDSANTADVFKTGSCTSADGVSEVDVLDSPGLFNTCPADDVQDTIMMFDFIEKAINISADGINAFVIVFRYRAPFCLTDSEQKVLHYLETFDPGFFAKHVIVVFTYGAYYRLKHGSTPFEDWVVSQMADMRKLFDMCQGRYFLFDNVTCTAETAAEQRGKLLETVSTMTKKFTAADFKKTTLLRQSLLLSLNV